MQITDEQKEQLSTSLREAYAAQLKFQQAGRIKDANRIVSRNVGFLGALEVLGIKDEVYAMATKADNGSEQLVLELDYK